MTDRDLRTRVLHHLELIYPELCSPQLVDHVLTAIGLDAGGLDAGDLDAGDLESGSTAVRTAESASSDRSLPVNQRREQRWDQSDVAVITYADSVTESGQVPLRTLAELLDDLTGDVATVVHVLPIYPSSSDGGFAVIDHRAVDPRLGSWDDVRDLAKTYTVMADLVANHVSAEHLWVKQFCRSELPGSRYLLNAQPEDDLAQVVRPRTTPLLREVSTPAGRQLLWCTFSHDQFDLDYKQPEVLVELLRTVSCLIEAGVRWFRLDAIAYLWKEPGTTCLNLPQTHEIVKLLRTLLSVRCPEGVIITETNVPHEQNVAYWGNGDEAHLVYNFSLPPLVVHTMISGSAVALQRWLEQLGTPPAGASYLNFIASHDGIGLRPAEGLLAGADIARLVAAAHSAGGTHSDFDTPEGPKPYELNVSLWDLFASDCDVLGVAQFLAAHTIMLSLAGIPALYVHALLGTPGNGVPVDELAQHKRSINRRKLKLDEAAGLLASDEGVRRRALVELVRRMMVRRDQPAFHPDADQTSLELGPRAFGVIRGGSSSGQTVVSVTNVTNDQLTVDLEALSLRCPSDSTGARFGDEGCVDLLDDRAFGPHEHVSLAACQTAWLCLEPE